jgi:hypothetical protein
VRDLACAARRSHFADELLGEVRRDGGLTLRLLRGGGSQEIGEVACCIETGRGVTDTHTLGSDEYGDGFAVPGDDHLVACLYPVEQFGQGGTRFGDGSRRHGRSVHRCTECAAEADETRSGTHTHRRGYGSENAVSGRIQP